MAADINDPVDGADLAVAGGPTLLVTKDNQLRPGEHDRAGQWGREPAALLPTARPTG